MERQLTDLGKDIKKAMDTAQLNESNPEKYSSEGTIVFLGNIGPWMVEVLTIHGTRMFRMRFLFTHRE